MPARTARYGVSGQYLPGQHGTRRSADNACPDSTVHGGQRDNTCPDSGQYLPGQHRKRGSADVARQVRGCGLWRHQRRRLIPPVETRKLAADWRSVVDRSMSIAV